MNRLFSKTPIIKILKISRVLHVFRDLTLFCQNCQNWDTFFAYKYNIFPVQKEGVNGHSKSISFKLNPVYLFHLQILVIVKAK